MELSERNHQKEAIPEQQHRKVRLVLLERLRKAGDYRDIRYRVLCIASRGTRHHISSCWNGIQSRPAVYAISVLLHLHDAQCGGEVGHCRAISIISACAPARDAAGKLTSERTIADILDKKMTARRGLPDAGAGVPFARSAYHSDMRGQRHHLDRLHSYFHFRARNY